MSAIDLDRVSEVAGYDIREDDIAVMLDELPEFVQVDNKGQLDEPRDSPYSGGDVLDDDEMPERIGRKGESSLRVQYSDFEVLFAQMAGEVDYNQPTDHRFDLPEENREEALGALFGASYALFRDLVLNEGHPAEHSSFEQEIDSEEERAKFFEEGEYEIKGEIMGQWGYDHELMNEVMDADQALETYHNMAEELV